HDFAGRFHFRTENRVHSLEPRERKNGGLDVKVIHLQLTRQSELAQFSSGHQLGSYLCKRHTGGLADEWYSSRCPRIDFQHVDFTGADCKLDVHQTHDIQRAAELDGVLSDFLAKLLAQLVGWQNAGAVTRMDAGFFNVFHDAADNDLLVVAEGIDID